jgi:hypothetical protein
MNAAEQIAISLPDGLAERARRAVRQGRAASVSADVASALAETLKLDDLSALLEELAVPPGAVGEAWRDERRQARLARLLGAAHTDDDQRAREAGQLSGVRVRGTADVIDASVALCARTRGDRIVTSKPHDANGESFVRAMTTAPAMASCSAPAAIGRFAASPSSPGQEPSGRDLTVRVRTS